MRRLLPSRPLLASGAAAALVSLAPALAAAECRDPIAAGCVDADQAWPHPGPSRFPTIGGTETVARGRFGVGLVTSWVYRPILLRVATPAADGTTVRAVEQQYTPNLLWSFGVTDRFAVDVALPFTVAMTGEGASPITGGSALRGSGVRDGRFGFTYALIPRPRVADAVLGRPGQPRGVYGLATRLSVTAPWGDGERFLGGRTVVFAPSIAGDYRRGRWFAGAELGARLRGFQEFAGTGTGPQGLAALGLGVGLLDEERLSLVAEGRVLPTLTPQRRLRRNGTGYDVLVDDGIVVRTPLEGALGVRSGGWFGGDFAVDAMIGSGVSLGPSAIGTPTLRAMIGLRYAPLDRDSDGDGVLDKDDLCPREKEIRKPGGVRDGCTDADPEPTEFVEDPLALPLPDPSYGRIGTPAPLPEEPPPPRAPVTAPAPPKAAPRPPIPADPAVRPERLPPPPPPPPAQPDAPKESP